MTCVNCYQKGSVPRTFLATYFQVDSYATAIDYSSAANMVNDDDPLVKLYDNIGVSFDGTAGEFTIPHAGRYLVKVKVKATHDTTDGTHVRLALAYTGSGSVVSITEDGLTNTHPDDEVFVTLEAYASFLAMDTFNLTLELVGHTTGTPNLTVGNVFVEIVELT